MRGKLGNLCMVLGAALVLTALSLFLHNQWEASGAEQAVQALLPQLQQQIQERQEDQAESGKVPPERLDPTYYDMTEAEIDGYAVSGAWCG